MSLSLVSLSSWSAQGNGFFKVCLILLPTPTPLQMQFCTHVGGRLLTDPFHHLSCFLWLTASLLTIICLGSCPVLLNLSLSVYFLRWRLQYESTMICLRSCPVQFSHLKTWVNHVEVMHTSANSSSSEFPTFSSKYLKTWVNLTRPSLFTKTFLQSFLQMLSSKLFTHTAQSSTTGLHRSLWRLEWALNDRT